MQGSFSKGLQTLHPSASPGWQLLPAPGSQESGAGSPALGVMTLLATSSCLSPFQSRWVLPSAFPSAPGPCWRISLHIARISELQRDACPGTRPSVRLSVPCPAEAGHTPRVKGTWHWVAATAAAVFVVVSPERCAIYSDFFSCH